MSRLTGLLTAVACLALLVSCSTSEAGTPRADSGATRPTESDESPPATDTESSPPGSDGDPSLRDVEPCDLLSASEVAELGVAAGKDDDNLGDPGCSWTKSGDFGFSVYLTPDAGVDDANLDRHTVTPVDIGSHEARQAVEDGVTGECAVLVAISESSSVDIWATASGGEDTAKACGVAMQVARILDPKLP